MRKYLVRDGNTYPKARSCPNGRQHTDIKMNCISWRPVLLVEETGRPGENHRSVVSHVKLYHKMLYTSPWSRFELTTPVVIGTDCIGSWKSNYHTVPDLPLCLGVLKQRASLSRGPHLPAKHFITLDFWLCGAILNLKAFCFGAIPDIMIELIAYWSVPQSKFLHIKRTSI